jgi:hypothetical protein
MVSKLSIFDEITEVEENNIEVAQPVVIEESK